MIDFTQMQAFSEDPLILTEGDGIRVRDVDGRWYIDGLSGTFCMSLGHGNARVVEAASKQLSRLALAAPTMATSDRSLELARELLALLPPRYTTLKWGSGGSEAIEAAIKMARQFHRQAGDPRKYKVLSHYRGYHGVTGHALAASGWRASKSPYEPLAAGFVHLHTPDPYRPPFDVDPAEVAATYVRLVEQVIELEGPETIAALVTEPILMTAGVVIPPEGYLPALRELCDRHDIVLDLRRDHHRLRAHRAALRRRALLDLAGHPRLRQGADRRLRRALGDGDHRPPRAGVLGAAGAGVRGRPHLRRAIPSPARPGSRRSQELRDRDLVANAAARGEQALERLRSLQARVPGIGDVRGQGLLFGVEFVRDRDTKEPFPAAENVGVKVREAARRKGLLLRASHWMAVLAPPLTTTAAELDELLDIFDEAMTEVLTPLAATPQPLRV